MIHDFVKGNILASPYTHICFAVNTEGYNDAGFAGLVASKYWPELADTGPKRLGETMTHTGYDGRVFHALVCHSLKDGWEQTPEVLTKCLDSLALPQQSAIVLVGGGMIGQMYGANVYANLGGIARSQHSFAVYSL